MGNVRGKKIIQNAIIFLNKICAPIRDKLAFSVALKTLWKPIVSLVSHARLMFQEGFVVIWTFYLAVEFLKLSIICDQNWEVLSGRCMARCKERLTQRSGLEIILFFGIIFYKLANVF